jgi:hypothetical protein
MLSPLSSIVSFLSLMDHHKNKPSWKKKKSLLGVFHSAIPTFVNPIKHFHNFQLPSLHHIKAAFVKSFILLFQWTYYPARLSTAFDNAQLLFPLETLCSFGVQESYFHGFPLYHYLLLSLWILLCINSPLIMSSNVKTINTICLLILFLEGEVTGFELRVLHTSAVPLEP